MRTRVNLTSTVLCETFIVPPLTSAANSERVIESGLTRVTRVDESEPTDSWIFVSACAAARWNRIINNDREPTAVDLSNLSHEHADENYMGQE